MSKKRLMRSVAIALACILLFPLNALAATQEVNDNHTDTLDYCFRVHDVTIGLTEIQSLSNSAEIENVIKSTADPVVLISDQSLPVSQWTQLEPNYVEFDFSQFSPTVNTDGYVVVLKTVPVAGRVAAMVEFRVFVHDDLPKPVMITVSFVHTNLTQKTFDITVAPAVLRFSDIPTPTKEGAVFKGWYLDEMCTQPFLLAHDGEYSWQELKESISLYPKFEEELPPQSGENGTIQSDFLVHGEQGISEITPAESAEEQTVVEEVAEREPVVLKQSISSDKASENYPSSVADRSDFSLQSQEDILSNVYLIIIIGMLIIGICVLFASIFSDFGVLRWYGRKKRG